MLISLITRARVVLASGEVFCATVFNLYLRVPRPVVPHHFHRSKRESRWRLFPAVELAALWPVANSTHLYSDN